MVGGFSGEGVYDVTAPVIRSLISEFDQSGMLDRTPIAFARSLAHDPAALVAINDQMADWASPLSDADEVLFFPPVAGG